MATTKPSRQEYLSNQIAKLPAAQQASYKKELTTAQKGGISSAELKALDAKINTVLYGVNNTGGTAGTAPWAQPAPAAPPVPTLPDPYAAAQEAGRRSAFALLEKEFQDAGLTTLATEVKNFMKQGYSAEEASLYLPETEAYKTRFAGNTGRITRGLPAYKPNEYLQAEQTYRDLFSQYGLPELATQDTYNSLIGGAVSIDEAKTRITNVFNVIDSASTELKQQLNQYFSQYGVGDPTKQRSQVALALMQGPQGINQLESDLRKAQIRTGAALSQVSVEEPYVTELEKQLSAYNPQQVANIAKEAYSSVAQTLPTAEKLAQISGETTTGLQQELTQEAISKSTGVLMPSQRRKKLEEMEQARFAGKAGTSTVSLSQKATAGQF